MNIKKHSKRLFSMLYSIVFLVTSLFVSIDYIKAENNVTKYITKSQYTELVKDATISGLYSSMNSSLSTNDTTNTDEVAILIDYNGGTCNGNTSIILTKHPNENFGILSPIRKDCVFSGWEILSGDSTVVLTNGSYILTVGSQDTIIRAIWKTETGEDVADTPTPTTAVTTTPTETPTATPTQRYITITVSLEGGSYNGEHTITKKVADRNTIVLFEDVDLLEKDGYKVTEFISKNGGNCTILSDKRVLYTAPSYDNTKLDLITVAWEKIDDTPSEDHTSATPTSQNTVYINLDGGTFNSNDNQEETYYIDVNTTKILFRTSDIKRDGYTLKGFKITDGVQYLIQGEYVILLSTDYKSDGITMTAIWEANSLMTSEPTIEPTNTSILPTIVPTQIPTAIPTYKPTIPPTNNTIAPTMTPTQSPTTMPTMEPTIIPTTKPTMSPTPVKITLQTNTLYMGIGENVAIKATATQKAKITYKSQNNLICSVTSNGIIVGHKVGKTQVIIHAGEATKRVNVRVLQKPAKIGLTTSMQRKAIYSIKKGKTKHLKVYFYRNSYSNKITFASSNKKVATVTSTGIVTAKKRGTCKITVKAYNGKKAIATIKVK